MTALQGFVNRAVAARDDDALARLASMASRAKPRRVAGALSVRGCGCDSARRKRFAKAFDFRSASLRVSATCARIPD
jgi:hypothetical protein